MFNKIEVGHGVHKSDIDARIAALSSDAIFTWLWQYAHDDDVRRYVEIFHCCSLEGEGELEFVYNDRESINNDSLKGIFIVISLVHEVLCI